MNGDTDRDHRPEPFGDEPLRDTLAWVLRAFDHPAASAGDWIAHEVDPSRPSAVALLTDPTTPVSRIRRARVLWAALRAEGETAGERTMGSRLAVAAAASAFLFHGERISNHDDEALLRALRSVTADDSVPAEVRTMVRMAELKLSGPGPTRDAARHPSR
jgi:hypothetical protein